MTDQQPPESAVEATTDQGAGQDQGQTQDRQERRDDRTRAALRQAEAERDALRVRLDRATEAEVHRQLGQELTDVPMALRAGGRTPADFVGSDGLVDAERVAAFAKEIVAAAPGFRRGLPVLTGDGQRKLTKDNQLQHRGGAGWGDLLSAQGGSTQD